MSIILVGLNHSTAPVGLRERLSLTSEELCMALKELHMDYQLSRSCTGQTNMIEHITALLREGIILSRLFSEAVHTGKRAHRETVVSRHTASVGHAAVLLMQTKISDLRCARVLVVGAGEMAQLAARALQMHGAQTITYINRTDTRAEALARQLQGIALPWHKLPDALAWADGVITTTSAPHAIIASDDVREFLPQRNNRPLAFVDIAVPSGK